MAFFAPVADFFLLADAELVVDALGVVAVVLAFAAGAGVVEPVATFLFDAFFAGEAERFRLVPAADFGLLDERAFFVVLADFWLPLGVFDRLRGLAAADFFAGEAFFFPAVEPFFFAALAACTLKLPLAPTPLVCFNVLFFVPARKADLRC